MLGNVVAKFDLDRADGRVDAVREGARLVSSIRDKSKVEAFSRELAGMVGVDIEQAREEVRRAANRRPDERSAPAPASADPAEPPPRNAVPDPRHPRFELERETLKLVLQHPGAVGRMAADVGANDFTHPTLRTVWELVEKNGGPTAADAGWAARIRADAADPVVQSAVSALGVEPLKTAKDPDAAFVAAHVYGLQELTALRRIAEVKSRLQRTNPVEQATEYNRMFGELVALEQHRRTLRELRDGRPVRPFAKRPAIDVAPGERVLAWTEATTGELLAGTREALYLGGTRLGWQDVEAADWDRDTEEFRVAEVGRWGEPRVEHRLTISEPRRLLELVRERVTASVLLVRHVPLEGRRGVRVIARRAPGGDRALRWIYEYDAGIDPDDPTVRLAAETALAAAQDEVGLISVRARAPC